MFLMIDNYDSFVYNLLRYFKELNQEVLVYRNDEIDISKIRDLKPEGIIISPGPKSPKDTKECLKIISEFKGKIPILGICLGHQCIGEVFNANVIKGDRPVHGKVHYIKNDGKGVFSGLPNKFKVTRYHSLIIEKETIPEVLEISAVASDGTVMGIRHKIYDIEGVQFHPEAELTQFGHEMLNNFIKRCLN